MINLPYILERRPHQSLLLYLAVVKAYHSKLYRSLHGLTDIYRSLLVIKIGDKPAYPPFLVGNKKVRTADRTNFPMAAKS